jgi:hypothetical protein
MVEVPDPGTILQLDLFYLSHEKTCLVLSFYDMFITAIQLLMES